MDDFGDTGGFGDGFGGGSVFMNGGHPTLNLADPSLDQEATECDTQDHATSAGGRSHTSSAAAYYESQTASIELASPEGPQAPLSPLQALQQQLQQAQQQQQQYQQWFVDYCEHSLQQLQLGVVDAAEELPGSPLSTSPAQDIALTLPTIYTTASCSSYVAALKSLAEGARDLDRRLRELDTLTPSTPAGLPDYAGAVYMATETICTVTYAQQMLAYYGPTALHTFPQLSELATAIDERLLSCRKQLRHRISMDIQECLAEFGWPPPLAPSLSRSTSAAGEKPLPSPPITLKP